MKLFQRKLNKRKIKECVDKSQVSIEPSSNNNYNHHDHQYDDRPVSTTLAVYRDTLAYFLVIITLLNFTSAAFIETIGYVIFNPILPKVWYNIRLLGIRWGWLYPVIFTKWANIQISVGGAPLHPQGPDRRLAGLARLLDLFSKKGNEGSQALVILNHLSWADSFVLSPWLYAHNALNGDTCWPIYRWFIYIPLGWIAYMSECPFLGYGKDRDLRTLQWSVTNFFKRGFSKFFLFPEGAIYRREMVSKSHDYAEAHALPKLHHCLLPKVGAFTQCSRMLEEQGLERVLDVTLAYPLSSSLAKNPYDVLDLLRRHDEPMYIHLYLREYSIKQTYESAKQEQERGEGYEAGAAKEKAMAEWLVQRFVEKDRMLSEFYQGKGPLRKENLRIEMPSWYDISIDVLVWWGVQYSFYTGFSHLASQLLHLLRL